ncbi:MAG TPA: hotdog fold domain-containing protein [Acidimicrobiia bacterium]|nr:hotdog fold domain-containing protein [Acidimicrobiia bacterium]
MTGQDLRAAAADALRDLNHAFVGHDTDDDRLRAIATAAEQATAALRAGPRRDRLALMSAAIASARAAADDGSEEADLMFPASMPGAGFSDRAVAGTTNPTSIDIDARFEGEEVVADVVLRRAFEGAPGRAHGGIVAAAFDDVTGFVIGRLREPAFTGELTVRFHAAVPVEQTLRMVSRLDGRERRKLFISAEAHVGDQLVASCRAIYVTVDSSKFAGALDPR